MPEMEKLLEICIFKKPHFFQTIYPRPNQTPSGWEPKTLGTATMRIGTLRCHKLDPCLRSPCRRKTMEIHGSRRLCKEAAFERKRPSYRLVSLAIPRIPSLCHLYRIASPCCLRMLCRKQLLHRAWHGPRDSPSHGTHSLYRNHYTAIAVPNRKKRYTLTRIRCFIRSSTIPRQARFERTATTIAIQDLFLQDAGKSFQNYLPRPVLFLKIAIDLDRMAPLSYASLLRQHLISENLNRTAGSNGAMIPRHAEDGFDDCEWIRDSRSCHHPSHADGVHGWYSVCIS